jgi:biopolymer transport protein TolQ
MMDGIAPTLPLASLWGAFWMSSLMGQAIVVLQLIGSIFVWAIMVGKGRELRMMEAGGRRFLQAFVRGRDVIDLYLDQTRRQDQTPLDVIYQRTCERLVKLFDRETRAALIGRVAAKENAALTGKEIELLCGTAEHTLAEQVVRAERGMSALATATTAAPLVGLLGTVWGVLDAFQIMGLKGVVQLSEMAPALSSAMLTTVVGLLVAIPSGVGYNMLQGTVRRSVIEMEGFVDELTGRIACEFQGKGD